MSNDFYNPSGYPAPNAPGASASMRGELDLIEAGFSKLPTLTSNGNKLVVVNPTGTALAVAEPPAGDLVGTTATQTLTNKTVNLSSNTLAGTTAQFNTALSDGDFATLAGTETLTNKSLSLGSNTLAGTTAQFNAALTDGDFATLAGTETLTNKTISGGAVTGAAVTGLATPTAPGDAASKAYVDSVAEGLDAKASSRVATTANITLSGTQTIDGVTVSAGDRVLVKDQSTASQNGIYVVAVGSWARASDTNTWAELVSAFTFVEQGTNNAGNGYICTVTSAGTLGSTSVTWAQFSSAGQLLPGAGLTRTGNTLDVATASVARIVVNPDNIDLAMVGTAGTYRSVTTDAYGRVTGGTNPTTIAGYSITDAYTKTEINTLYGDTASAAASAAAAAASYDAFDDRWLGAKATAPTVDNDGNPLVAGAAYFSTTLAEMRVWNGTSWQSATTLPNGVFQNSFTATAGQTSYAWTGGGSYAPGMLYVYVNGVLLSSSEYTATDGTNISFSVALTLSDEVQLLTFKAAGSITAADVGAQATLVSGTNIKTVNGTTLLGSGNLAVGDATLTGAQALTNKDLTSATNTFPTSLATLTGTQTLTNKTFTSPILGGAPDLSGSFRGNITAVAALDIDCALGNYFTKTIAGASTFTFSNPPTSRAYGFTLELTHTSGSVTWPTAVQWPLGIAPTLTTGKTHLFVFTTDDGGTRWRGAALVDYTN